MTEPVVIDSNVFIVGLLDLEVLDSDDQLRQPSAISYLNRIQSGEPIAHLPRIAIVEIVGVTRRKTNAALASVMKNRLSEWVTTGLIELHDLDQSRMTQATDLVIRHNISRKRSLSAPDAEFIALAEELELPVVSFEKYFKEVSDRAEVPV